MSALANILLGEAIKIVAPIVAEQFAAFAAEKEPEVKAYLAGHFGHGSPLIEEFFQLLIEPGLVTIGGLLATVGGQQPVAATKPAQAKPVYPDYRDN